MGIFLTRNEKYFAVFSLGILLALRSLSKQADGGYVVMFIPGLSYFALKGISQLWILLMGNWMRFVLSLTLITLNFHSLWGIVNFIPGGMNHKNSNFDEYVAKLARRFPDDGYIYQKDISILPYLKEARGGDLDAIRFRFVPETRQEALPELSSPGCKLIIISRDDLEQIGLSETDMIDMGYSVSPYVLTDSSGNWMSYSKECNAWEYD